MLKKRIIVQIGICMITVALSFYFYLEKQNRLTDLRIKIPKEAKENLMLKEEIARLQYEIDRFEDPQNLMHIAAMPEYSHLQHPFLPNVVTVEEGLALQCVKEDRRFSLSVPVGTH